MTDQEREQVELDAALEWLHATVSKTAEMNFGNGRTLSGTLADYARLRLREVEQELPGKILDAVGKFSDGPLTLEDALRCLREYRETTEKWQATAESRLAQAGKLAEAARAMTECQGLWWRDGDCTPRCHCCDAAEKEPHFPDCHAGALRSELSDFDKL